MDIIDYVAEGMKSNAFMHTFVSGGWVVVVRVGWDDGRVWLVGGSGMDGWWCGGGCNHLLLIKYNLK